MKSQEENPGELRWLRLCGAFVCLFVWVFYLFVFLLFCCVVFCFVFSSCPSSLSSLGKLLLWQGMLCSTMKYHSCSTGSPGKGE